MKRFTYLSLFLLLLGTASWAWAEDQDDIAKAGREYAEAFHAGNAEAIATLYAENAHLLSAFNPFRAEGRAAIQAHFTGIFQASPTRRLANRQPLIRVFNGTTAVANGYFMLTLVDRTGKSTTHFGRYSVTYMKMGGRWLRVEHHASLLPASP